MEPVRILQEIVAYLNEHVIDDDGNLMSLTSADEVEGTDSDAEVRISWGGRDLFDLLIRRV